MEGRLGTERRLATLEAENAAAKPLHERLDQTVRN